MDFARRFVDRLTVLVCSLDNEPIPGTLRHAWMSEMFPDCEVVHVGEDLPQDPSEHPDFWRIWREVVRRSIPTGPDFVFASEPYGYPLAEALGSRFIPVDPGRNQVPVSGSAIRAAPMAHWEFLPACVRPYFVRRICVYGPESTGKTTLAEGLARHYRTSWVAEFARALLDAKAGHCDPEDIPIIARGQAAAEDARARAANRLLFCDTDLFTTVTWANELFGACPPWIEEEADRRPYDLYLLLDVDVPWVDDAQRYFPDRRRAFFERMEGELIRRGRSYTILRGDWTGRFEAATLAIDRLRESWP